MQDADRVCGDMQIVAYDFGIKHNILRRLASFGCKITVVPADYPASKVLEMNPDGPDIRAQTSAHARQAVPKSSMFQDVLSSAQQQHFVENYASSASTVSQ